MLERELNSSRAMCVQCYLVVVFVIATFLSLRCLLPLCIIVVITLFVTRAIVAMSTSFSYSGGYYFLLFQTVGLEFLC